MKLVIAEKPSVGSTIASVVGANTRKDGYIEGNGFIVSWCFGHLIGLESPDHYLNTENNYWNMNDLPIIPGEWQFSLANDSGVKKQYKILKQLMYSDDVDEIICATDAGREGECIFRYVYNYAKCKKPVKRLWVSSLEESAIKDGMNNLKDDSCYDNLFESGLCRAKADWLIGMNLTRGFSIKYNSYKPVLSIGRVQTPTLAMIVDRYNQFNNFVVETYYKIDISTNKGFIANSVEKYTKEQGNNEIERLGTSGTVSFYENKEKTQAAPKLFDLTLLQRQANILFGYTAKETLDIAQSLYESKLITYPRTDSNYITDDMENTALSLINRLANMSTFNSVQNYVENMTVDKLINNKKVSDHHALLPTKEVTDEKINGLPKKEKDILILVCQRLLIAASPKRSYSSVKCILNVSGKDYEAKGVKVIENGYKDVEKALGLIKKEEKENNIPELSVGESISITNKELSEHQTQPPKLYTDDTLLKAMEIAGNSDFEEGSDVEKKGIGTPATRAGILETLVMRDYITREKKKLIPTKRGINLINIVPDYLKSAKITASWETELQGIEKGNTDKDSFLQGIEKITKELTNELKSGEVASDSNDFKKDLPVVGTCPFCKSDYIEYNKVYKCSNKECDSLIWKSMSSKKITRTIVKKLLKEGRVENVDGFVSKSGKEFSANLTFNEHRKCIFDF